MTTTMKQGKRSAAKGRTTKARKSDFPAREPEIELLQAPEFDPAAGAAAGIGCLVTLKREGVPPTARYCVIAAGAHRLRVVREGEPRTTSFVVPRGEVSTIASRPERKRSGAARRPPTLRVPGDAPVSAITEALIGWAGAIGAPERVAAALSEALKRLEAKP